jgi:hypothetical protein
MQIIITLGLLVLLVVSVYQDFRFRAISWIVFPLLACLNFLVTWIGFGIIHAVENTLYSSCFIILQLSLVSAYYSIKHGKFILIINEFIGLGDILFLFSITPLFPFTLFVLFLILALSLILLIYGNKTLFNKNTKIPVPMAGLLAMALFFALLEISTLPELSAKPLDNIIHSVSVIGSLVEINLH